MSAKHTPGPWRAIDSGSSAFTQEWTCHEDTGRHSSWQPIVNDEGHAIALVVDSSAWFDGRSSFAADARLIAAAPDQHELLGTFTEWARQVATREDVPMGIRSAAAALHDDGKRLLAKATGSAA